MDVIEQEYWDRGERDALAYAKAYAAHDGVIWETAIATLLRPPAGGRLPSSHPAHPDGGQRPS